VFGALPWLPTSGRRVAAVLDRLPPAAVAPGKRFIDLGSGDGEAVIVAAKRGMAAHGVEINPTLVAVARVRAAAAGLPSARCSFALGNLWATPLAGYDVIMVFGVPPMMARLQTKLEAEADHGAFVCSHKFPLPGWAGRRVGHADDDMHVYQCQCQRSSTSGGDGGDARSSAEGESASDHKGGATVPAGSGKQLM
jgi:SAM-dependent methyltransferase